MKVRSIAMMALEKRVVQYQVKEKTCKYHLIGPD
jgi:hypothetical protein